MRISEKRSAGFGDMRNLGDTNGIGDTNRRIQIRPTNLVVSVPNSVRVTKFR